MVRLSITTAYQAQYSDPIRFEAGEPISVGRADTEFDGWYWCRSASGKEGWVHQRFLSALRGEAVGVASYTARELTVAPGSTAELLEQLGGWLFVRLADGTLGWLPESHAQIIAE